jgi:hypothetical protein
MKDSAYGAYASVGSRRHVYRSRKGHGPQVGYYRDMNGHLILGEPEILRLAKIANGPGRAE